jgi:hypothetical protein
MVDMGDDGNVADGFLDHGATPIKIRAVI